MTTTNVAAWSRDDQLAALKHGWGVYHIWDGQRFYNAIQRPLEGKTFATDADANQFVAEQARLGDSLALRAMRFVFQSHSQPKADKPTKNTPRSKR